MLVFQFGAAREYHKLAERVYDYYQNLKCFLKENNSIDFKIFLRYHEFISDKKNAGAFSNKSGVKVK